MNKSNCMLLMVTAFALQIWATDYYYVGGSNEWNKVSSYSTNPRATAPDGNTTWPGASDMIQIRNNQKLFADDGAIQYLNAVDGVYFNCTGAQFTIVLSGDAALRCRFGDFGNHGADKDSVLVKDGPGTLSLCGGMEATARVVNSYLIGLDVMRGRLNLGPASSSSGANALYNYGDVTVRTGAELYCVTNGTTVLRSLAGGGVVTNVNQTLTLAISGSNKGPTEFSGTLSCYILNNEHSTYLTGTANTFSVLRPSGYEGQSDMKNGVIGFRTLGETRSGLSSFGTASPDMRNGSAWYLFLGDIGETICRDFNMQASAVAPIVLDAGAHGGLTFGPSSRFRNSNSGKWQQRLVLTGSNTVNACVLANPWENAVSPGGLVSSFYVTKRGTGKWRFADRTGNNFAGVLAVEDGTVEFETIAETNRECSLGYASALYEDVRDLPENLTSVDYAYLVGADGTCGMMDYVGVGSALCSTRRIAVKCEGGLSTSAGLLKWSDVRGAGSGEKTLVLGGGNTAENTVADVSDGPDGGTLSVRKEGSGSWTLTGGLDFDGDVTVNGGSLIVRNVTAPAFKWFRLVLKENVFSSAGYPDVVAAGNHYAKFLQLAEFALYDADGVRRNVFGYNCLTNDAVAMSAMHASVWESVAYSDDNSTIGAMFNDTYGPPNRACWMRRTDDVEATLGNPESWINIDCRIADDAPAITHYDLNAVYPVGGDYFGCAPAAYEVKASADGINWERVGGQDLVSYPSTSGYYKWISDDTQMVTGETRKNKGYALTRTTPSRTFGGLSSLRSVRVAADSTLKLVGSPVTVGKLTVDAAGAGSVEGPFVFGANGTLEVLNASDEDCVALPGAYSGITGLENVRGWALRVNGRECRSKSIVVRDAQIFLLKKGFCVIVR